jgi:hypothetical protein
MSSRLLLALTLVSLPAPVVAQSYATRTLAAATTVRARPIDSATVAAELARADEAAQNGRGSEARRILRKLIEDQEASDQFAGTAMWRLALYLFVDDRWRAAMVLDELAGASNRYGDPATELRATFEAAVLWQQLKRPENVNARLGRVKALLQSPVITEEQKASVRERM